MNKYGVDRYLVFTTMGMKVEVDEDEFRFYELISTLFDEDVIIPLSFVTSEFLMLREGYISID
jgi:hypothetical protein